MPTITARLQPWLEEEIREFWAQYGEGSSGALRNVAEEWWTLQNCPNLEFREELAGRRAGIRGGPDVWEVACLSSTFDQDLDALYEHFGGYVSRDALRDALIYADRFPQKMQQSLANNTRIERLLRRGS